MRRFVLCAALAAGAWPLVAFQTPQQPAARQAPQGPAARQAPQGPTFRSKTELVRVDVVVVDADGHTVRGLTRDDFTIREKKKTQPIATFEEVSHESAPSALALPASVLRDVADNSAARASRLVVIVLDDLVIRDFMANEKALAHRVVEMLGPEASIALLLTSNTDSVEATDDRARLFSVIDAVGTKASQAPHIPRAAGRDVSQPSLSEQNQGDTSGCHTSTFFQAAHMLAADESRRKAFVYISPGCGAYTEGFVRSPQGEASLPADDPSAPVSAPTMRLSDRLTSMINEMRRANVAMYAIDPRGVAGFSLEHFATPDFVGSSDNSGATAYRGTTLSSSGDPVVLSQEGLMAITAVTGGFAITNTNEFDAGLARIVDDFDHYYVLTFYPDSPDDKTFRTIDVTVDRPNLIVRYRHGYQLGASPPGSGQPKNADPLAGLSVGVLPVIDLPLRVFAIPLRGASPAKAREAIVIEVRPANPVAAGTGGLWHDNLRAEVLALDVRKTKVSKIVKLDRAVSVAPPAAGAAATYQVATSMDLEPGRYQLRVSVTSAAIGKSGSVYLEVDVPDYGKTPIAMGGILVGDANQIARGGTMAIAGFAAAPIEPVLDRFFTSADTIRLVCEVWRTDRLARPIHGTADLIDAQGRVVRTLAIPAVTTGGVDVNLTLNGVAPGAYQVRVSTTDGHATASRAVGIGVR